MLKTCSKCKKTKPINEFYLRNEYSRRYRNQCKECMKEYRENNKEKIAEYKKEYRLTNKVKIAEYQKEYIQNHKGERNEHYKRYCENNKKEIQKRSKEYYQKNKEKCLKQVKEYQKNNKEKIKERKKEYRQNNIEKINEHERNRRKKDPKFKLNHNISNAIRISLHGNKNGKHWEDLVGYTLNELKMHLEKQFAGGMNWDNYGEWHIDHRIPLSAFNFTKPEHIGFQRAWALENLQPLWAEENLSKTNKLFYDFQSNLAI